MIYLTIDDLQEELGNDKLLELIGTGSSQIDEAKAEAAIASATDLVNVYLGVRYQLPPDEVPKIVRWCTLNIAIYYIYLYKCREMLVPIEVTNLKNEAIRILEQISTGILELGLTPKTNRIIAYSNEKYFTRDHLDEFKNSRE